MRRVLPTRQAVTIAAVAALGVVAAPAVTATAASHAPRQATQARPALPAGQQYVCPPAKAGWATCMSIIKTASGLAEPTATGVSVPSLSGPWRPVDLRKAYKLSTASAHSGRGRVVAIVDAFNDPHAAADLAKYRKQFHLPPCTTSNGCLHILNQHGKSKPLPRANAHWAIEESLDLDMVSAICPLCHITLIEASNSSDVNLGISENTAINRGAKYVSNSWGNFEFASESSFAHYFNHPGHVIDFAAGDLGFGSTFPASLQTVTSIGGTALHRSGNSRGFTESVWGTSANSPPDGTASGCSSFQAKPSWQRVDIGFTGACVNRTENDASAVADPNTGVIIYDSYKIKPGFYIVGGTSASTPIITAIYALAGAPVRNTYPAQYPYLKASHLFDVTSGANGTCGTAPYLCHGLRGYDGPTGLGTPNGTASFTIRAVTRVTLLNPGTQHGAPSSAFSLRIKGLDSRKVSSLKYSMSTQPSGSGLTIKSVPNSTDGLITGTLPSSPVTFNVTVTAKDGSVTGTTHFQIVVS